MVPRRKTLLSVALVATALAVGVAGCSRRETTTAQTNTAAGAGSTTSGSSATPATTAKTAAAASAGCGHSHDTGTSKETMSSGGEDHTYLLTVPDGYTGNDPRPMVFDLHGLGATAEEEAAYSRLGKEGQGRGYITITPNSSSGTTGKMWLPPPVPKNDEGFIRDLLAKVPTQLCVDTKRVYVAGISNGALMTGALSCDLADQLAGAAMVAGPNAWRPCDGKAPVPLISFEGTADPLVPYAGGKATQGANGGGLSGDTGGALGGAINDDGGDTAAGGRPGLGRRGGGGGGAAGAGAALAVKPAEESLAGWAKRNGCTTGPTSTQVASDVTLIAYANCTNGADTQLYRIEDGGHTWPGAKPIPGDPLGKTTQSIDASKLILDFFDAHGR